MLPLPPTAPREHGWWPVLLAGSIAAGAWLTAGDGPAWLPEPPGVPLGLALTGAAGALASRRPALVCLAAVALVACLAQRSLEGLTGIESTADVYSEVTLVSDPRPTPGGGIRADVRLDGRRLALEAHRSPAAALRDRLAGERVIVAGKVLPPSAYEERLQHRHLAGRLQAEIVVGWHAGHGVTRAANGVRRTLADGAGSLPDRHQSLLAGLLIGDDREHPEDLTEAFRESGLAHLLAVSGDNVLLAMLVLSPLLTRLRLASRLVVTLVVLGGLALVTRGEPSVLRATVMAAIGAYAAATGRPVAGLHQLAGAVTALLLIDPLLVTSLGFQLSVAATAGIIIGAHRLADRLPGPRQVTLLLGATAAAEVAVAPLVVATFGSVPLVSLLANLLASSAAAWVKVWGLSAGLIAGLAGEPLAGLLHMPSMAMLWWLDGVAVVSASLPVGELRAGHLGALAAAGALVASGRRARRPATALLLRLAGSLALAGTILVAALAVPSVPAGGDGRVEIGPGMVLWRGGAASLVVIDGRATEEWLVSGLQREQTGTPDVLILRTAANRTVSLAVSLLERWPQTAVLAPAEVTTLSGERVRGAVTPEPGAVLQVGALRMTFDAGLGRLEPHISLVS